MVMDLSESWEFGQVASLTGIDDHGLGLSTAGNDSVIRPVLCFMPGKPKFSPPRLSSFQSIVVR